MLGKLIPVTRHRNIPSISGPAECAQRLNKDDDGNDGDDDNDNDGDDDDNDDDDIWDEL